MSTQLIKPVMKISTSLIVEIGIVSFLVLLTYFVVELTVPFYVMIALPSIAMLFVSYVFYRTLKWKVKENILGEIGLIYLALIAAYTLYPAIGFALLSLEDSLPFARLFPSEIEIGKHLWRHVLFAASFAVGYIFSRGNIPIRITLYEPRKNIDNLTVLFIISVVLLCIAVLLSLSLPVESYYGHYARYDHLPWLVRKFVSFCLRLNLGMYSFLLVFLFLNYKRFRKLIPVIVGLIAFYEISYSLGSRIQTLIILLQSVCLYSITVKHVSIKHGIFWSVAFVTLFSIVELIRVMEFDFGMLQSNIEKNGIPAASEFGAVFLTGFHLYAEMASNTLPSVEWQMFFNDFFGVVTFGDFLDWNPTDWYRRNYFPHLDIAPYTLGPIANSAIWGGELDLLFRGIVNGLLFSLITRQYIKFSQRWWAVGIYSYCYATSILTLKYSVFYQLTPIVKTMLMCIIIISLSRGIIIFFSKNGKKSI